MYLSGLLEGKTPQGLSNGHETPPEKDTGGSEEKAEKGGTAVIPIGLTAKYLILQLISTVIQEETFFH